MKIDKGFIAAARIKHTTIIQERCNAMNTAVIDDYTENKPVLFQPRTNFMMKQQLMCVPMLIECIAGQIDVLVVNTTDQPVKVYRSS